MGWLGVVASLVLGAAFVVAGASKLAIGPVWPQQARDLGAPVWTIPIVPWVEIVLGALLVTQLARPAVAGVAIAVQLVFTALLVVRLAQGERPPCACFGAWSARPIGAWHIVRNLALMGVGVVAVVVR